MFASRAHSKLTDDSYILPIQLLQRLQTQAPLTNSQINDFKPEFCLFLDIDGTISEFNSDPSQSYIDPSVKDNIKILQQLGVPIIAVTGRSLSDAIRLFHPLDLTIAATHGLQIQFADQNKSHTTKTTFNFSLIDHEIIKFTQKFPNIRVEHKTYARALHVREHPEFEPEVASFSEQLCLMHPEIKVHKGKFVYEIILKEANKGHAIKKIYHTLTEHTYTPVFIGDDKTDEAGFEAVNALNGITIKVGSGNTKAQFRLQDVKHVVQFIHIFQEYLQAKNNNKSPSPHLREIICQN